MLDSEVLTESVNPVVTRARPNGNCYLIMVKCGSFFYSFRCRFFLLFFLFTCKLIVFYSGHKQRRGLLMTQTAAAMSPLWLISFSILFLLMGAVEGQWRAKRGADPNTVWPNNGSVLGNDSVLISTYSISRCKIILWDGNYACGFWEDTSGYLFGTFMISISEKGAIQVLSKPVWAANRNRYVEENATLEFTSQGNLVLQDKDGSEIWSTGTSGKGARRMSLDGGNLVILAANDEKLWESFSWPTDILLPGQAFKSGMNLTSSISDDNPAEGFYVLEMRGNTLSLSAKGSPLQTYWSKSANGSGDITPYAIYANGSILFFMTSSSATAYSRSGSAEDTDGSYSFYTNQSLISERQFLKLDPFGKLGVFIKADLEISKTPSYATFKNDQCDEWPGSCGLYSLCSNKRCSCLSPDSQSTETPFVKASQRTMGCQPGVALSGCNESQAGDHHFMILRDVYYPLDPAYNDTRSEVDTPNACQQLCSTNCSCKMAIYSQSPPKSYCFTYDQVYTLTNTTSSSVVMVKVQGASAGRNNTSTPNTVWGTRLRTILLAALTPLLAFIVVGILISLWKRMRQRQRRKEELALDAIVGLPRRYSYRKLQQATSNFNKKLGQGAFGTVFLAEFPDNEKFAVKRLDNASQDHKDFRTEVSIIGRVRHMNLVQLKGFCAENHYRTLVYELVVNSSLDKWLFAPDGSNRFLNWDARLKIALGTARGLAYLHEGCGEKILHLDVKPQNILLDADLNAKVCDFGLSRLVRQEETSVLTTMRGTPGYMAPEWLQFSITEKVDVYSYGVVLLELLSGQRCLDMGRLQDGDSRLHFPSWASQRIAQGGNLEDVVDQRLGRESESQVDQMTKVLDFALLCTQGEPGNRPSMGRVVQVLEDIMVLAPTHEHSH